MLDPGKTKRTAQSSRSWRPDRLTGPRVTLTLSPPGLSIKRVLTPLFGFSQRAPKNSRGYPTSPGRLICFTQIVPHRVAPTRLMHSAAREWSLGILYPGLPVSADGDPDLIRGSHPRRVDAAPEAAGGCSWGRCGGEVCRQAWLALPETRIVRGRAVPRRLSDPVACSPRRPRPRMFLPGYRIRQRDESQGC